VARAIEFSVSDTESLEAHSPVMLGPLLGHRVSPLPDKDIFESELARRQDPQNIEHSLAYWNEPISALCLGRSQCAFNQRFAYTYRATVEVDIRSSERRGLRWASTGMELEINIREKEKVFGFPVFKNLVPLLNAEWIGAKPR